jgi:hypothetical protein
VKYVPPAYSAVSSEGVEVEGEEVEESEGAQKCYLTLVDHKLSMQKYYFFKIGFWGHQTVERALCYMLQQSGKGFIFSSTLFLTNI